MKRQNAENCASAAISQKQERRDADTRAMQSPRALVRRFRAPIEALAHALLGRHSSEPDVSTPKLHILGCGGIEYRLLHFVLVFLFFLLVFIATLLYLFGNCAQEKHSRCCCSSFFIVECCRDFIRLC